MNSAATNNQFGRGRSRALLLALSLAFAATMAAAGGSPPPTFTKAFLPDTIGPGSVSMLTFTIDNSERPAASMMAFDDELPFGMDLAAPAFVSNTCGGTVTLDEDDADSGFDVRLVDGMVGADKSCKIVVNVTATTDCSGDLDGLQDGSSGFVAECANASGDLTSSAGNSGPASASLFVNTDLPGFSKAFSTTPPTDPPTVPFGGRSTLTFTIDNSASTVAIGNLDFTDQLPPGMAVAGPNNAATDCVSAGFPNTTVIANPGTSVITLDANGIASPGFEVLAAGATCTVMVDVIGGSVGSLGNVSGNLLAGGVIAGKAAAVLEVTGVEDLLELSKEFIDDPAAPGGQVTLRFTVTNKSRDEAATAITFDDDLGATLAGLAPAAAPGLPADPCGAGSSLSFTPGVPPSAVLALSGGTLPPEGSCVFSVVLDVPAGAMAGTYPNTAGPVSGDVGGFPETGNTAGDLLFVVPFPRLTKSFTPDTVAAGDSVTLEFTITNPAASAMTGIAFDDELTDNSGTPGGGVGNGFLPFPVSVTLPPVPDPPCGAGSALALTSPGTDRQALSLTGGSLAEAGMAGDSCTFSVTVGIPLGLPGGTYLNTTEPIRATVAAATVVGPPASDDLVVASAPSLSKEFTDDPVLPAGGPVTLEFNLSYDVEEGTPDATDIAFTDDLTALTPAVPGLVAASVDTNTCPGAMVDISTPSTIAFSGGTLAPGASCTVVVTLTVPAASPVGSFTNTTSKVTATVDGVGAENLEATDTLLITPLTFTKEFTPDTVIAGDATTLTFTIDNTLGSADVTTIIFSDTLDLELTAALPPVPDPPCGVGSSLTISDPPGPAVQRLSFFSSAILTAGSTCSFSVPITVSPSALDGLYTNATESNLFIIGGSPVVMPAATDVLDVNSTLLELTKEFTDDPVAPGDSVTLEFTLTNLDPVNTASAIAFSDNLGDAGGTLLGLEAQSPAILNDCGGMATLPATDFSYSGGSLAGGASCTIRLSLKVPVGPISGNLFPNTTSSVSGTMTGLAVTGDPATDDLEVQTVTFSKSFDGPTTATSTAVLTFTLTNLDASSAVSGLAFSDDLDAVIAGLDAVLPPTPDPPCGAGSVASGTSFLAVTGASLAAAGSPGDSCTFDVTVAVPESATAGSFLNITSILSSSGLLVADPATAFLDIEPAPTFAKAFVPDTIFEGEVSTLTFTIDNTASALAATGLDFTDVLPSGVVVATPSGASTDCTGGMLTAVAGTGTVSYTDGEVADGASCTVVVDVTSATADVYVNTTGDLTSSSGNSGPASDTLTVEAGDADLELVKADVFEPVMAGRFQIYTLTVTNLGPATAEAVVIDDVLPAGTELVLAEPTAACSEAMGVVSCAVGDLALGEAATVVITLYVVPSAIPAPIENLATVTSDTPDLVPANNDVMESTEVLRFTGLAMLDDVDENMFPEAAAPLELPLGDGILVLVKDVFLKNILHMTEVFPDGWALTGFERKPGVGAAKDGVAVMAVNLMTASTEVRVISGPAGALLSTAVVPAGYLPVTMEVIPDDGGVPSRSLIVTASIALGDGPDGRGKVHVFDCSDGSLVSEFFLHPGAVPMGLAAVDSFAGDALSELGILWINETNGGKRLQVKELSGTQILTRNLPLAMTPLALERVANCCLGAADELAAVGWDRVSDKARLWVTQADGGGLISDGVFASKAQPIALRSVPSFAATTADELVTLFRNANGFAAVRGRDAMSQANVLSKGYGAGSSVPLGLGVSADAYDSVADEVAVFWLDPATGRRRVTLRDAGSGFVVETVLMQVVP